MENRAIHLATLLFVVLGTVSATRALAIPEWAKKQFQVPNSNTYKAACSGEGPAVDIARSEAIRNCKISVSELLNTDVKVNSLTIDTEKDSAFHREISETARLKNLRCEVERDEVEEHPNGTFIVWILCRFDMSKIRAEISTSNDAQSTERPHDNSNLSKLSARRFEQRAPSIKNGTKMTINIISIPQCGDLLIRGKQPRVVRCDRSPTPVSINSNDETIIVRAKQFKPKTIDLAPILRGETHEAIQVIFEQN